MMASVEEKILQFRPKARIIRTIGDQLISGPEAAVIELVKNAYDADANYVAIKFFPPLKKGAGRISITDDGHGMSLDDIRLKWMEPATSAKVDERVSPGKHRRMMGSKGIGRFAAAKLGKVLALTSTTLVDGRTTAVLIPKLDWSIFNDDIYLSDVGIEYLEQSISDPPGTTLEITELHEDWTREKLERLHAELRRLLSPLAATEESDDDFRVYLDLSECTIKNSGFDGAEIVSQGRSPSEEDQYSGDSFRVLPFPLLAACDYELIGTFDRKGGFHGTFQLHRAGRQAETIDLPDLDLHEEDSPAAFDVRLYVFDREAEALKSNMKAAGLGELSAKQSRELLDRISGVAIYRGGFRVRPYGDPKNDWLALDSRRVQDPSLRIGHNQIAGYISIQDEQSSNLVERSSREGFEENAAFQNLSKLVKRTLAEVIEPKRYQFRTKSGLSRRRISSFDELKEISELKRVRRLFESLEPAERERAETVIDQETARLQSRVELLQERQRVLEAKSSLGAILAEVLHEGSPEATFVQKTARRLNLLLRSLTGADEVARVAAKEEYNRKVPMLQASGDKLSSLFSNLRPLAGGRRGQPQHFYPIPIIENAARLFEGHAAKVNISTMAKGMELIGYPDDLTTAMVNLVGNALYWLEETKTPNPKIDVVLSRSGSEGRILVEDNGPGIPAEFADSIFDVGFTLKEGGTGLGLNISQEALARSGARLTLHLEHDGGALFEIIFPAGEEK